MTDARASRRVPLARPEFDGAVLERVRGVLDSGHLTLGPVLAEYERVIAAACDVPYAVGCTNGTAALHLALLALDVGVGDEVIVPAYTFPATANVVALCGATPVFCDVAPGRDVAGVEQIEAVLSSRTRAIMVVHLFGCPVDMDPVLALAARHGIPVVEDAAGALGSRCAGRPAGSLADAGTFSLHPRKAVTTGEGGAIVCRDEKLAARMRRLRHHGIENGEFVEIGLNYRLPDILAAIALPQLEQLEQLIAERTQLARRYDEALADIAGIAPAPPATGEGDLHAYQAYVARLDPGVDRQRLIGQLAAQGVESQVGTYCVPGIRAYRDLGYDAAATPHACDAADRGLALPLFTGLKADEQQYVVQTLAAALSEAGMAAAR